MIKKIQNKFLKENKKDIDKFKSKEEYTQEEINQLVVLIAKRLNIINSK